MVLTSFFGKGIRCLNTKALYLRTISRGKDGMIQGKDGRIQGKDGRIQVEGWKDTGGRIYGRIQGEG